MAEVNDRIRAILRTHGGLASGIDGLTADSDLYRAGMTSHASVNVMLALESEFDVEFPDRMLRARVFSSMESIRAAIDELSAGR